MRIAFAMLFVLNATAAQSQQPRRLPDSWRVPRVVMDVVVIDSQIFKPESAGVVFRYGSGQAARDVYLYGKDLLGDPAAQVVVFLDVLPLEVKRGHFESYNISATSGFTIVLGDREFPGHEAILEMVRKNAKHESYFAVVELPDFFVKFRITRPIELSEQYRDFVTAWVREYFARSVEPQ